MYQNMPREYYRDMAEHGLGVCTMAGCHAMGTFIMIDPEKHSIMAQAAAAAIRFDMMVEAGLNKAPILCLSTSTQALVEAPKYGRYVDQWPELIHANQDEPSWDDIPYVKTVTMRAHAAGFRVGTALAGYSCFQAYQPNIHLGTLGHYLDVWIVSTTTWQPEQVEGAHKMGAELWAYTSSEHRPDRDRFIPIWCWKYKPKVHLWWAYTHHASTGYLPNGKFVNPTGENHAFAHPSIDGPVETESWAAAAEGIKDHKLLTALENLKRERDQQFLQDLRDQITTAVPRDKRLMPFTDFDGLRAELKRRLPRSIWNEIMGKPERSDKPERPDWRSKIPPHLRGKGREQ